MKRFIMFKNFFNCWIVFIHRNALQKHYFYLYWVIILMRDVNYNGIVFYFNLMGRSTCKQILVLLAWKGVRKLFAIIFSNTILKQFFNILASKSKYKILNWTFLAKDLNFLIFHSLALLGQNASRGKFI